MCLLLGEIKAAVACFADILFFSSKNEANGDDAASSASFIATSFSLCIISHASVKTSYSSSSTSVPI